MNYDLNTLLQRNELLVDAEWANDCSGKMDFDGQIIAISTRYWPRGGSHFELNSNSNILTDNTSLSWKGIKPSASSSLNFYYKSDENSPGYDPGYTSLVSKDFEAETEHEVRALVEDWTKQQIKKIAQILKDNL